jgi:hypothetical protein
MLKRWISGWMAVTLAGGLQGVFKSAQTEFQAAKPNVALVELFTSEGCSSCPPADDLLRRIDGSTTDQGLLIVGISEHVTYWDHDGWKDPYGSETMTERQNDYGRRFNLESVYTPQMVVNGEAEFVGSDGRSLVKAVTGAHYRNRVVDGRWCVGGSKGIRGNAAVDRGGHVCRRGRG